MSSAQLLDGLALSRIWRDRVKTRVEAMTVKPRLDILVASQDPASLAYLDGSVIDFDDGLHGKGFEIKNPNAQSTCGCGKSFS